MTVIVAIKVAIWGNANTKKNVSHLKCLRNECEMEIKQIHSARVHYILHRFILDKITIINCQREIPKRKLYTQLCFFPIHFWSVCLGSCVNATTIPSFLISTRRQICQDQKPQTPTPEFFFHFPFFPSFFSSRNEIEKEYSHSQ